MSTSENPALDRLRGVRDPLERAAETQAWIARGRAAIQDALKIRDAAIRESHPTHTIDDIADHVDVKRNVVVHALRAKKG